MTLPPPKENTKSDNFGWNAGPREITSREINNTLIGHEVARDTYLDGRIRERQLNEQSEHIIRHLERMGIQGRTARGEPPHPCSVSQYPIPGQKEMDGVP
ncbi:hypothetical protein [Varunaivibrio sulfuroxidans]|uniref:Uncharacterized protein n=1 Tax=Varunaivibrio sulfuroxidans TaxID=1773489 RepID=A0A4R3JEN8_9PROT|nr:hypothetical protein [Varunaivibrio sulfuroxidans]TCS64362.1 hypothetical protein EDD55_102407 [Varunaivibrio sulfuroxidans]WES31204.1 hypothetical protein P3M64_02165 [Varunaivibrio sulfuroxidans]